jgi:hypothetical protein
MSDDFTELTDRGYGALLSLAAPPPLDNQPVHRGDFTELTDRGYGDRFPAPFLWMIIIIGWSCLQVLTAESMPLLNNMLSLPHTAGTHRSTWHDPPGMAWLLGTLLPPCTMDSATDPWLPSWMLGC